MEGVGEPQGQEKAQGKGQTLERERKQRELQCTELEVQLVERVGGNKTAAAAVGVVADIMLTVGLRNSKQGCNWDSTVKSSSRDSFLVKNFVLWRRTIQQLRNPETT